MYTIYDWAVEFNISPHAVEALVERLGGNSTPNVTGKEPLSEAGVQSRLRLKAAEAGVHLWRNNVGATKARETHECPRCQHRFIVERPPLRYGLANDSSALNDVLKSSDLIGITPRVVTPADVGKTLGIFTAYEVKHGGWVYSGTDDHIQAQLNFLLLVSRLGGIAAFANNPDVV